jgi:winged helix DNA-binding protein
MVAVMAPARRLNGDAVRRLRTAAQHLHRPRRRSAADLVRHLTGVQAQVLPAAGLALRARTEGLTAVRVDGARVRDRSIVLTWAMRGTLHLIAAEDYGRLVPLVVEPRVANAHRRLKQEGVSPDQSARAVRLIEQMLERDGPLTRPEIAERLRGHRIRTEGQAIAHLVWLAAAEGLICHGPDRDRTPCFVLVRDWLGDPAPMDHDAALAELAVRYLRAHGPAEPADLAFWSGIRSGDAERAWHGIEDRLVEVSTTRGPRWALRSHRGRAPAGVVRLIPSFDEYLLGWKDRAPTASNSDWKSINRGGGWLRPVVLVDGRAAATWRTERTADGVRVEVAPFSRRAPGLRRGVAIEAKDLGSFLGNPVEVVLD